MENEGDEYRGEQREGVPLFHHLGPWPHPTPALARRPDPSHRSLHIHAPNVRYLPDTVLGVAGVTVNKLRGVSQTWRGFQSYGKS